jgi:16S rRNA (adenine1518-N6/adenine1519-N6)-dimethyltransferase
MREDKVVKLVSLIPLDLSYKVFEIGVGKGVLTKFIAPKVSYVEGYEVDKELYEYAIRELSGHKNVKVRLSDALSADPTNFDLVLGNLPYSISRRFIEWLIINDVKESVVVLQKDFVDKLLCKSCSRKYGTYSVLAQYFYEIRTLKVIPPDWFVPPPKVTSLLVRFRRRVFGLKGKEALQLIKKVKEIFSHKRKKLRYLFKEKEIMAQDLDIYSEKRVCELEPYEIIELVKALNE